MKTLALTGGIACGKSRFGSLLAALGAEIVDADQIVRSLHASGGKAAAAVAETFGPEFLDGNGATDRTALARKVFAEPDARLRLESILHPLVRTELLAWRASPAAPGVRLRVAEIPLLFDAGWDDGWDATATIETRSLPERIARLRARGLSEEQARARIAAQLPAAERIARADFAIFNDGPLDALPRLAHALYDALVPPDPS